MEIMARVKYSLWEEEAREIDHIRKELKRKVLPRTEKPYVVRGGAEEKAYRQGGGGELMNKKRVEKFREGCPIEKYIMPVVIQKGLLAFSGDMSLSKKKT